MKENHFCHCCECQYRHGKNPTPCTWCEQKCFAFIFGGFVCSCSLLYTHIDINRIILEKNGKLLAHCYTELGWSPAHPRRRLHAGHAVPVERHTQKRGFSAETRCCSVGCALASESVCFYLVAFLSLPHNHRLNRLPGAKPR